MALFQILTVCTGNICRSPLAEVVLRHRLRDLPRVSIESAGTHALVGRGMESENITIAEQIGATDARNHAARRLTVDHLEAADLILGLSREHRLFAAELAPSVLKRSFTLREFARLSAHVPADGRQSSKDADLPGVSSARTSPFIEAVAAMRGQLPPLEVVADDDVVDPYRQSEDVYRLQATQLLPAVDAVARAVRDYVGGE